MNRFRSPLHIFAWAAGALAVFVALMVIGQPDGKSLGPAPKEAFQACLRFASERLKLADHSTFSPFDPQDVESSAKLLGQHPSRFEVAATVESPDRSGTTLRNHLKCDVILEDGAKEWNLVGVSVQ